MSITIRPFEVNIKQQRITVGTSPTLLPDVPIYNRRIAVIQNLSTNQIFLGGADVATSGANTGIVLSSQYSNITLEVGEDINIYGIAGANSDVSILELS